jgi:ribonuclease J
LINKSKESDSAKPPLRVLVLGGAGEIGLNCFVFEQNGELLIIDCGIDFPEDQVLGVELMIPDLRWVIERKERLAGIVLTHGHEDHIGGLPFLLREAEAPVFGTRLTLGLLQEKLREHKLLKRTRLEQVSAGERRKVGGFEVEFIQSSHSIADVVAIALRTEQGIVLHSGDFKLDPTPVDGKRMDLNALARLGEEGVLAFFSDSTNVEQAGYTPSEREVGKALFEIFEKAPDRIIIALFASHIHRIQQVVDAAQALGRKVLIQGRSMEANTRIAQELGYLHIPSSVLVSLGQSRNTAHDKLVVITTGSQGEPLSALSRMVRGEHKQLKIIPGDTVIFSSKFIPGNERAIQNMINELYRQGAEVFYETVSEIHCSGHASQEELKFVLSLVNPKFFIPVHGEYRHLVKHKQLAVQNGMKPENCLVVDDGTMIEFSEGRARVIDQLELEPEFLDSSRNRVPAMVLKERLKLAQAGVVFVDVAVNKLHRQRQGRVQLQASGVTSEEKDDSLFAEARARCEERVDGLLKSGKYSAEDMDEQLRTELKRFFKHRLARKPVLMISIREI